nr:TAXI family TRAP transporter solute-binding subunit [Paeniglutamicibacter cryotolerans]
MLGPVLAGCAPVARSGVITVAGGEPGGFYLEFAELLAASLQLHGVAESSVVKATGGSLDNIGHLLSGRATLAVALADAASGQVKGGGAAAGNIVALGKVYENYVHALVRKDSGIRSINDLAGRTAGVGRQGSGTSQIAPRILEVAELGESSSGDGSGKSATMVDLGLNDGLRALIGGGIDALFWSGGVPTAAIAAAHRKAGLALLDLSATLPALRQRYGSFYDKVLVPEDSYAGMPAVWTVGVANLLLCRGDLDASTVRRTVELLVGNAGELIPQSSVGVQFLSPESLINTADVPLHPDAAAAYRELHG